MTRDHYRRLRRAALQKVHDALTVLALLDARWEIAETARINANVQTDMPIERLEGGLEGLN